MSSRIHLFSVLTLLGTATLMVAQTPVYRRPVQEEKRSTVGFSTRMLLGVSLELHNLGDVGFPVTGADPTGDRQTFEFANGQVAARIVGEDAEGNPIFADNTSYFRFSLDGGTAVIETIDTSFNSDQLAVTAFTLESYRSQSRGASAEATAASNYGWEVTYGYQFGTSEDRFRWGFMAGFSIGNLDFDLKDHTVVGDAYVRRFTFTPNTPILLPDGVNLNGSWGSAEDSGKYVISTEEFSQFPTEENANTGGVRYEDYDADQTYGPVDTKVAVNFEYDGIMAMLRIGPTADLRLIDELHLELSAGLVGVYLGSRITLTQALLNLPTSTIDPDDTYKETRNDYLFGYFAEGLLRYQMTPRVGFFSSMMYMNVSTPKDTVVGTVPYDLALTSPVFATAGMRLTF